MTIKEELWFDVMGQFSFGTILKVTCEQVPYNIRYKAGKMGFHMFCAYFLWLCGQAATSTKINTWKHLLGTGVTYRYLHIDRTGMWWISYGSLSIPKQLHSSGVSAQEGIAKKQHAQGTLRAISSLLGLKKSKPNIAGGPADRSLTYCNAYCTVSWINLFY